MKFVLLLVIILVLSESTFSRRRPSMKNANQCNMRRYRGCNIESNQRCVCGRVKACKNPFAYRRKSKCKQSAMNSCAARPCLNGGMCLDMAKMYKCECSGTGYYGTNCGKVCPVPDSSDSLFWQYPSACVSI